MSAALLSPFPPEQTLRRLSKLLKERGLELAKARDAATVPIMNLELAQQAFVDAKEALLEAAIAIGEEAGK